MKSKERRKMAKAGIVRTWRVMKRMKENGGT